MEVQIKSIHFDATEKLQDFVQKKTAKLEKLCDEIQKVEVQLTVTKPQTAVNKQAAITVKVPGNTYYAEKLSDTFEESIDGCIDALKVQLEKFKEKMRKM
ncbi:MAG: ribosome-associated translation inhibitor RaiA [Bacteroidaceae bacterium]|nr:ribosome-associated translation inhibitor RaiA [Bacteroidaceae bacterium]